MLLISPTRRRQRFEPSLLKESLVNRRFFSLGFMEPIQHSAPPVGSVVLRSCARGEYWKKLGLIAPRLPARRGRPAPITHALDPQSSGA
jgi:hypothetical protein